MGTMTVVQSYHAPKSGRYSKAVLRYDGKFGDNTVRWGWGLMDIVDTIVICGVVTYIFVNTKIIEYQYPTTHTKIQ